jgi:hypothetical protein
MAKVRTTPTFKTIINYYPFAWVKSFSAINYCRRTLLRLLTILFNKISNGTDKPKTDKALTPDLYPVISFYAVLRPSMPP